MAKITKYYLVVRESIINGARALAGERVALVVDEGTWTPGANLQEITLEQMDPKVPIDVPGEPPKPEPKAKSEQPADTTG